MKALLLYAEQDMHDFNRQATAFALLKAVLARKLVAPEMHDVMDKVAKLSITSEHAHIRLQARQVSKYGNKNSTNFDGLFKFHPVNSM
jgi:U3 small nucleolar RNA-associated protein 20